MRCQNKMISQHCTKHNVIDDWQASKTLLFIRSEAGERGGALVWSLHQSLEFEQTSTFGCNNSVGCLFVLRAGLSPGTYPLKPNKYCNHRPTNQINQLIQSIINLLHYQLTRDCSKGAERKQRTHSNKWQPTGRVEIKAITTAVQKVTIPNFVWNLTPGKSIFAKIRGVPWDIVYDFTVK